ncbi:hypothetical protein PG994_006554 [Apiospora phragmitis]|uniref:Uncharacterized protein n=1 Tax=Apiospora phragmitis TaxID=2905665 RepID=A0ABR1VFH0_9PEZI
MEADAGRSGQVPAASGSTESTIRSYQRPGYHPYEAVQVQPPQSGHRPFQAAFEAEDAEKTFTTPPLPWRPSYLRRFVIVGFIGIFAAIIAAIEALLAISNKSFDGIATSQPDQHYLWTYGPIAFLTLVSALWGRAEYQSKLVAPWRRLMQPSVDAKRTLLLDYVSGFPLFVVFKALRNKDWTVSITCAVSVLMKILIVISTGLITLSWTGVHVDDYPMIAQDTFSNNSARLSKTGSLSYFVMKGLIGQNLTYPDGMSKDYAFQSVLTNLPNSAETKATVDGLTNGLDCVPADVGLIGARPTDPHYPGAEMKLTVTSPGCNIKLLRLGGPICPGYSGNFSSCVFGRFARTQCDGTNDDEGARVLLMFGKFTYTMDYSKNTTDYTGQVKTHPLVGGISQSSQMLCVPTYTINRVDVVRNDTQTLSVELASDGSNRTLDSIRPWAIMDAHFAAYDNELEGSSTSVWGHSTNISTVAVDVDEYFGVAIDSQLGSNTTAQVSDMLDPGFLKQFAESYYRQFAAIVAKQSLMEPASIDITGTAVFMADRLLVRSWSAQLMAGLTAVCLVLSAILLFTVPKQGILPRNLSNIPDMASLILHSPDLQTRLRDIGAVDQKSLARTLDRRHYQSTVVQNPATGQAEFAILDQQQSAEDASQDPGHPPPLVRARRNLHPSILHPATRLTLCLILIGLIIALEILLQKSNREDGLGDVGNDTYIHYLWTTLPALTFGLMAMTFSSMDFQLRSLAPYMLLKRTVRTDAFMRLDHLDMSIPRTIYKEARSGNIGALATTTMLLVSSFFTIFSGSLFQALAIPSTTSITLRANQSFNRLPFGMQPDGNAVSSLILDSNLSYPSFTHEGLAFPQLIPDAVATESNSTFNLSTVSVEAVVPAVRSRLDCRHYDLSKHRLNLTLNYTIEDEVYNPLGVFIEGEEECIPANSLEYGKHNIVFTTYPNATYIGKGYKTHISSLGCNLTFERVDVDVTFLGPDLRIDTSPGKAPRPREDTARDSTMDASADYYSSTVGIYGKLANIQTDPQLLDQFFGLLVSSRYALPISDLGDPAADEKVIDAIRFQHGVIMTQALAQQRLPAAWSNVTLAPAAFSASSAPTNASDAQTRYVARATNATGRRRVMQDAASTRALEALLGAALALLGVAWLCMRQTDCAAAGADQHRVRGRPRGRRQCAGEAAGRRGVAHPGGDRGCAGAAAVAGEEGGQKPRFWIGRFGIFVVGEEESITEDVEGGSAGRDKRLRE